MPPDVQRALNQRSLEDAYRERPPYQRNDYVGWIEQAKREEARAKRIEQMLDELERGDVYMNMTWQPARRRAE